MRNTPARGDGGNGPEAGATEGRIVSRCEDAKTIRAKDLKRLIEPLLPC